MLLIDDLLLGGLRFVLDKLATLVDQEMNDESRLHQTLMEAQMRFEIGEISADEFAGIERTVIARLREIRAERDASAPALSDEGVRISSIEIAGPDADVNVEMPTIDIEPRTPAAMSAGRNATKRAKSGAARTVRARRPRAAAPKAEPTGRGRARR